MSADETEPSEILKWSRDTFYKIVWAEYFPSAVQSLSIQKDIITRFYNFYLSGKVQKGMRVENLVFAVLSILPQSPYVEEAVWSSAIYKDDGKAFTLTLEEQTAPDADASDHNQSTTAEKVAIPVQNGDDAEGTESTSNDYQNVAIGLYNDDDDEDSEYSDVLIPLEGEDDIEVNEADYDSENEQLPRNNDERNEPINELQPNRDNVESHLPRDISFPPGFIYESIQTESQIIDYGPVQHSAFITSCDSFLSRWDTDSQCRAVLKSFFAVVALVLMRATTKSYKHLFSTFYGKKFLRLLRHCNKCGFENYSPPHKRCLKRAYRTFSRRDGKTPTMFAKIVGLAMSTTLNKYLKYVINNGLMNYTSDYGFNLIRLLRTVCNKSGDVARVMDSTLCKATEASWERVSAFLREYCTSSVSNEFLISYRWARVLDSRFFEELSCQQNYGLAVILAVFAERVTGDAGVWQSPWVENDELEKYKELGTEFYECYEAQEQERRRQ